MTSVMICLLFAMALVDWPGLPAMRHRGMRGLLRAADEEQQR